jgi:hypothetical protein
MSEVRCFLVTPTGRDARYLRRYAHASDCPQGSYHNALVRIPDGASKVAIRAPTARQRRDPRWPTECGCGYRFAADDEWQVFRSGIYAAQDGRRWPMQDLPPGAMWYADWMRFEGPDGRCLMVRLPDLRDWAIDGPATSGGGWERTGEPPDVSANPSIMTDGYHGFLTDGVLRSV